MPDAAHGGEGWTPRATSSQSELGTIWADVGADSECGTLESVLLHRPGSEIEDITHADRVHWNAVLEPSLARQQHDGLSETYTSLGVKVHYLEGDDVRTPNMFFMRDLFVMTPVGAIITRPASPVRAGEERVVASHLARMGVPIVASIHGEGIFEGPDVVFVRPDVALVGIGIRSNDEGARQVSSVLSSVGIECHIIQTTYGCGHLDGVLNVIDRDKAVLFPTRISFRAYEILKRYGYKVIDLPDQREAEEGMAINVVAVAPGVVVMPKGNTITRRTLEESGVLCYEVDVSELMKGGGAMHCMTGILKRSSI